MRNSRSSTSRPICSACSTTPSGSRDSRLGLAARLRSVTSASPRSTVKRRAQLVADVGQEQDPQPVEVLEPAVRVFQLRRCARRPCARAGPAARASARCCASSCSAIRLKCPESDGQLVPALDRDAVARAAPPPMALAPSISRPIGRARARFSSITAPTLAATARSVVTATTTISSLGQRGGLALHLRAPPPSRRRWRGRSAAAGGRRGPPRSRRNSAAGPRPRGRSA